MDQPSRQRARGIRTIGRLSVPQSDDTLLAQWPMPADPDHQRQDVAIASEWRRSAQALVLPPRKADGAELGNFEYFVSQYEDHQQRVVHRLMQTIDAELESRDSLSLPFEPPSVPLDSVLAALDQAVRFGDLSPTAADLTRARVLGLAESVARLWALVDLHRCGHITRNELRQKRALVAGHPDIVPQ